MEIAGQWERCLMIAEDHKGSADTSGKVNLPSLL